MTDIRVAHPTGLHNFSLVHVGSITLAFSYETIIGYNEGWYSGWVVSENVWSVTTGKHLNWLQPDKNRRVNHTVFTEKLSAVLDRIGVAGARQPLDSAVADNG